MDTLNHRAGVTTRRVSLLTLGASGLATALANPLASEAKKKKKCKKKDKKCPSLEEICAPQVEDCIEIVSVVCGTGPECQFLIDCCEVFATCDASAFLVCLDNPPPTTPPR